MKSIHLLVLIFLFSCSQKEASTPNTDVASEVKYATGFKIGSWNGIKTLTITRSFKEAKSPDQYLLVPKGTEIESPPQNYIIINVPVQKIVATSTTHLAAFELLDATDRVIGFPGVNYIYSDTYLHHIEDGKLLDLGNEMNLDFEQVIDLEPDLFMGYTLDGDLGQYQLLDRAKIPIFMNAEYLEASPLGRAEWIKVAGMLTGKSSRADSVFNAIEENYKIQLRKAKSLEVAPTVISGIMYQGTWYMPGGRSWAARYFKDAGARFLWDHNENAGSIPLPLETVLEVGIDADFWVGAANVSTLSDLLSLDERYGAFQAFKRGHVYNYSKRVNAKGGNDYFEMAIMRPDLILKDLVNIFSGAADGEKILYFQKLHDDR